MNEKDFSALRQKRRQEQEERRKQTRFLLLCSLAVVLIAAVVGMGVSHLLPQEKELAVSGEQVETIPVPQPEPKSEIPAATEENDLLKLAVEAQGTEEKVCYLTFDDGPSRTVTPAILDALKEQDVKATFFVLGRMLEGNGDIAKRAYEEGHLLAGHSYSHQYKELYASGESFMAEVEKTNEMIYSITGEAPFRLFRFPGGSHNAGSYAAQKQEYKQLLKKNGYYFADWNCLNGDAEGDGKRPAPQLLETIKKTAYGKNIVVLMHDATAKKATAEALPSIITYLKEQGYVFKRLDEVRYWGGENKKPEPDLAL
ncbi:MAG: polysaccharide deacetylase [Clostridia bacterium]|nr:polysaccharide deacetylase [Clostridia bacterium]